MHLWRERWGLSESLGLDVYFQEAMRRAGPKNGVRAFKIQQMHVRMLADELGYKGDDVLLALLPRAKFVNLVRRDTWAQALSWFRAIETDEWWRFDGKVERPPPTPKLDVDEVRYLHSHLAAQQDAWNQYFGKIAAEVHVVVYEALDGDYYGEVAHVLQFLGLDAAAAATIPQPRLQRQADDVSARWRRELDADGTVAEGVL